MYEAGRAANAKLEQRLRLDFFPSFLMAMSELSSGFQVSVPSTPKIPFRAGVFFPSGE